MSPQHVTHHRNTLTTVVIGAQLHAQGGRPEHIDDACVPKLPGIIVQSGKVSRRCHAARGPIDAHIHSRRVISRLFGIRDRHCAADQIECDIRDGLSGQRRMPAEGLSYLNVRR